MGRNRLKLPQYTKMGAGLRATQDRKQKEVKSMWEQLQNFDADRLSVDEMIVLASHGKMYQAEFESQMVPVPEWLPMAVKSLRRSIRARHQDMLEALLKEKRSRREALTPAEERRSKLDTEIADLEKQLQEV